MSTWPITRPDTLAKAKHAVLLYRSGLTLQAIGDQFGVSRERIRQYVAEFGLSRLHGGRHVAAERNAKKRFIAENKRRRERNKRYLAKYGYSKDELLKMCDGKLTNRHGPVIRFREARNVLKRYSEWTLTFREWWQVWERSGRWKERGKGRGNFVMARIDRSRGFCKGNVHITTHENNLRQPRTGY